MAGVEQMDNIISIHAPTRGATIGSEPGFPNLLISIHAPTRGATFNIKLDTKRIDISIHAPTRGATWWNKRH